MGGWGPQTFLLIQTKHLVYQLEMLWKIVIFQIDNLIVNIPYLPVNIP